MEIYWTQASSKIQHTLYLRIQKRYTWAEAGLLTPKILLVALPILYLNGIRNVLPRTFVVTGVALRRGMHGVPVIARGVSSSMSPLQVVADVSGVAMSVWCVSVLARAAPRVMARATGARGIARMWGPTLISTSICPALEPAGGRAKGDRAANHDGGWGLGLGHRHTSVSMGEKGESIVRLGACHSQASVLKRVPQTQNSTVLGPMSTSRRASLVLHGSPWLYTYSHCHQTVTQQRPRGHPDITILQPTHAPLKTAKSPPVWRVWWWVCFPTLKPIWLILIFNI